MIYTIKKGAVNAKPNKTALRFVRDGAAWRVRFRLDYTGGIVARVQDGSLTATTEVFPVPPTHIKLLGLYWSGWMVWQRMREAYRAEMLRQEAENDAYRKDLLPALPFDKRKALKKALRQYPAWTHGNSARVLALWRERGGVKGVILSTYYYLQGKGAVTTGSPVAGSTIAWLPEDPDNPGWTVWGEVSMDLNSVGELIVAGDQISNAPQEVPLSRRPWFFGLIKPHAANGPSSPHAPCDLTFEMERI